MSEHLYSKRVIEILEAQPLNPLLPLEVRIVHVRQKEADRTEGVAEATSQDTQRIL